MMSLRRFVPQTLCLLAFLGLAACQSTEERAEEHYAAALVLLESGDVERAKVELRNVFQNDQFHEASRRTFAEIDLAEDNPAAAARHYRFIIEQSPDTPDVRLALAELALELGDIAAARRNGEAAIALMPDNPRTKVLAATFAYQDAVNDGDAAGVAAAAEDARMLLIDQPDNDIARRVVIDNMLQADDPQTAMPAIDEALLKEPDSRLYNQVKLQLLLASQDMAAIGAQLRNMVALYPEDDALSADLIRWYIADGDTAGAETFLREQAGPETGDPEGHLAVIQFLQISDGQDAALTELNRLADLNSGTENGKLYRSMAAVVRFVQGEQEEAIVTLESIISDGDEGEQALRIKIILAKLLAQTDNTVGARAYVEEVLATDASNVEALKIRAAWAIQADDTAAAIRDLRTALGQAPRDPDILSLMASAHDRDGTRALSGDRLSQAVEVTNSRAPEALRYVNFLLADGRTAAALNVLADARAANPGNVEILQLLGQQLLQQQSWLQIRRITDDLREVGSEEALRIAQDLDTAALVGQGRLTESLEFLTSQIEAGDTDTRTVLQLVQLNLRNETPDEARRILDDALAVNPDNVTLRMMDANLQGFAGDIEAAKTTLRDIIADAPDAEAPVRLLYTLLRAEDKSDEASAILQKALESQPDATTLFWIRAGELETGGDIDGAIAIYETLYARDSSNTLIANNLASLITTHRNDAESLVRAEAIARRLRDTDVPAFQDTYGWILYRQGNFADAEPYLAAAAEGLPNDPLVQFHHGITLVALERSEQARVVLTRALEIAGDSTMPQFDTAREALAALSAANVAPQNGDADAETGNN